MLLLRPPASRPSPISWRGCRSARSARSPVYHPWWLLLLFHLPKDHRAIPSFLSYAFQVQKFSPFDRRLWLQKKPSSLSPGFIAALQWKNNDACNINTLLTTTMPNSSTPIAAMTRRSLRLAMATPIITSTTTIPATTRSATGATAVSSVAVSVSRIESRTTRQSAVRGRSLTTTSLQARTKDDSDDLLESEATIQEDKLTYARKYNEAKGKRKATSDIATSTDSTATTKPPAKKRAKKVTENAPGTPAKRTASTTSTSNRKSTKASITTVSSPAPPSVPIPFHDIPVPVTPDASSSTIQDDEDTSLIETDPTTTTSKRTRPKTKQASTSTSSSSPKKDKATNKHIRSPPKEDWQSLWRLVEELRADKTAPVDTNGSEALPERHLGDVTYRFQTLIALMLSSQTKDATVGDAMRSLQQHGLTVDNIRQNTTVEQLNTMIGKVGFHNTKTKNIFKVVDILHEQYDGDIPPSAQDMIRDLPGVGPKMAFIVENVAWGKQTGIGVDTHMHRMFNQLKWVNSTQPEQTRLQLESWLPLEYWPTVNVLWVGLGQEVQQFSDKILDKALQSSRPREALKLLQRLGMDVRKVGKKLGKLEQVHSILLQSNHNGPTTRPDYKTE